MRALLAVLAVVATTPGVHHTSTGMTAAHRALLQRADLKGAWTAGAAPKAAGSLACRAPSTLKGVVEIGAAVSPTYRSSSSGPFVSSSAFVYDSAAGAASFFTKIAKPQALTCLGAALTAGKAGAGVTFTIVRRQTLPRPRVSATVAAYRIVGRATVSAQKVPVYADIFVMQRGNAISQVTIASFLAPVAPATENGIVRAASARL